ncbi:AMP-binding protein [Egicoccus halophilus]|uniref:Long-chain-fatty-acid--CoA ligase n=1 Tax=Egicoccus halophilus TaxID=1670830 RepID=A0A8J3ESE2_9ACTN|nr:AMP-binding protein [Egicoccus halophilus]GGI02958.1 long-chain-fatty-acid--CoA ligase [Egicoccus halophilus]
MAGPPDPASLERPWLASYPPGVPPTYRLPEVALPRLLEDAARDFPGTPALVADGASVDHAGLLARVEDVARRLASLGIGRGERVLVGLRNTAAAPVVLLASWRVGATVVPVAADLPAERLRAIAVEATVGAVVGTPRVLHELRQHVALPPLAVSVSGNEWPARRRRLRLPRRAPRRDGSDHVVLADLLAEEADGPLPAGPAADDVAALVFRARGDELLGVELSHRNLVANAFQARLWVPDVQAGRERVLVADPLGEVLPLTLGVLAGLLSAGTLILLDRPSPDELARTIERERPTLFPTVPARLAAMLADRDAARRDLTSLRVCVAGGAPLDPGLAAEVERRTGGARVREGYGLVEAAPLTHAQPVYGRAGFGTIGLPVPDTVAVVVDPDDLGRVLPPDTPGMLLVHGPQVARGYLDRDELTARTFVDGWLVTGDLATVDADGVFTHVGRIDEVVKRDGRFVSPRHVESALLQHPAVETAGVVSSGELLLGAVVTRRRARADGDTLLAHCRNLLDAPAVPDRVTVVNRLPRTAAGDLDRERLRRELAGR